MSENGLTSSPTGLIAEEVERGTEGEAWHGPAIQENLAGVSAGDAASRPIEGAHTIWEIVLHLTAWATEVERRLREDTRQLEGDADWPTPPASTEAAWTAATAALLAAHRRLRQTIREFPPARLNEMVPDPDGRATGTSFYSMLHGLAQHDAYHTGQIAMLRKAVVGRRAERTCEAGQILC
jgi:uncharacterized damage-inducible protein DinB